MRVMKIATPAGRELSAGQNHVGLCNAYRNPGLPRHMHVEVFAGGPSTTVLWKEMT